MSDQLNIRRIPKSTQEQLRDLIERTGMTQTQVVIVAIDRLFQAYKEEAMSKVIIKAYGPNRALGEIHCEGVGKPLGSSSNLSGPALGQTQYSAYSTAAALATIGNIEGAERILKTAFDRVMIERSGERSE